MLDLRFLARRKALSAIAVLTWPAATRSRFGGVAARRRIATERVSARAIASQRRVAARADVRAVCGVRPQHGRQDSRISPRRSRLGDRGRGRRRGRPCETDIEGRQHWLEIRTSQVLLAAKALESADCSLPDDPVSGSGVAPSARQRLLNFRCLFGREPVIGKNGAETRTQTGEVGFTTRLSLNSTRRVLRLRCPSRVPATCRVRLCRRDRR